MTYSVVLLRDEASGYSVHVPALKGCHTQGESLPEALDMARDAILCYLGSLEKHGEPFPPDVDTVSFDWGDASEALVYRVEVGEAVRVA